MKLNRSLSQWQQCDLKAMVDKSSKSALRFALEDAKHDIIALHEENRRLEKENDKNFFDKKTAETIGE